ncbi:hypothetical protein PAXINDRAFT_10321 [Paxillus involutus ATCC 200175]|nr:hypothetical protein PAXINDRAFT_10321 [Paxillus involutus ATCC 200175]
MSTHQWTISRPDMCQSELHMALYYVGCRIESAVSHLVHQPDENWPDDWEQLLDREFQLLHAMQQIHATRPTAVIPAPAVEGLYHASRQEFGMSVRGFDM